MKDAIIKKIKVLLGIVKQEFASIKLEDGSELVVDPTGVGKGMADSLEVGRTVYDTEGNPTAAGDYVLEDGTTITVDENSVITAITPKDVAEPETEVKAEEETPTETETEVKAEEETPTETETIDVEAKINELETAINDLYDMMLAVTEQLKMNETKVSETVEEFKAFKSQPSTQPISFSTEKDDRKMSRFEKLKSLK